MIVITHRKFLPNKLKVTAANNACSLWMVYK